MASIRFAASGTTLLTVREAFSCDDINFDGKLQLLELTWTRLSSCVGDFGAVLMVDGWWLGRHVPLAAPLSATQKIPVAGLALILGIDRFKSEARAITNFIGNTVATLIISKWDHSFDVTRGEDVMVDGRANRSKED